MVLKCTFSSPDRKKQALADCLRKLPPLSREVKRKSVYAAKMDKEGRTSIIVLYEFEEFRVMEVFREIFKQIDTFSGVPGFNFSAEICTDRTKDIKSMDEIAQGSDSWTSL